MYFQWQFNTFAENQNGSWAGIVSEFVPEGQDMKLVSIYKGRQTVKVLTQERIVSWRDESLYASADGGPSTPVLSCAEEYLPQHFRAANGAMAVDNIFSNSKLWQGAGGEDLFHADIWIRFNSFRTRCRFLYCSPKTEGPFRLSKIIVIKERLGMNGPTCEEIELFGPKGAGIYDDSSRFANDLLFAAQGGLVLSFPPILERLQKGDCDCRLDGRAYEVSGR